MTIYVIKTDGENESTKQLMEQIRTQIALDKGAEGFYFNDLTVEIAILDFARDIYWNGYYPDEIEE